MFSTATRGTGADRKRQNNLAASIAWSAKSGGEQDWWPQARAKQGERRMLSWSQGGWAMSRSQPSSSSRVASPTM